MYLEFCILTEVIFIFVGVYIITGIALFSLAYIAPFSMS